MLIRLRQALLLSAGARNLAVDLVSRHGQAACGLIEQELADARNGSQHARLLSAVRHEVTKLVAHLPNQ